MTVTTVADWAGSFEGLTSVIVLVGLLWIARQIRTFNRDVQAMWEETHRPS